ncbi:MAG TPA: quinolinate synthase NadA [Candidatus Binatia bacterium]|nr:quinolinate synthase NadA [Candidatus Binatia bacterium]
MAVAVASPASAASTDRLVRSIDSLRRTRNAVILAHNYQLDEVQDVADFVGDSLNLSRRAAATDADVIVFCGVHFMAETAAILSPAKTVLLPDLEAGCSLAETITADQLRAWKAEHPGAVVVSYVNTSAEVKAESDYCCTSGNAEAVIRAIPEGREILFCPDMFLGAHLERVTGRRMHVWMGECHVHAGISPQDLAAARRNHPDAELLVHPECGCTSSTVYRLGRGDLPGGGCVVASTEGMVRRAAESPADTFIVATEVGILHRLRLLAPGKRFLAASEHAVCPYMKRITLDKVATALERMAPVVTVAEDVAARARLALERMVAITG